MLTDEVGSLDPSFERAKTTLRTALNQACRTDIDRADTGELIRVEEMLAIANEAAKEAISVRRRLRSTDRATDAPTPEPTTTSREIEDALGVRWKVFAVHPSNRSGVAVRDRFREGWLSFDSGEETRRVAPIPEGWDAQSDDDLCRLCEQAETATRRRRVTDH